MLYAVAQAIILYVIVVFVLSRIFVPHFRFWREPLPKRIPRRMQEEIRKIKQQHRSKRAFAKAAHKFLAKRYSGGHWQLYFRWDLIFTEDLQKLWSRRGYIPCHQLNWLYRVMLVKSKVFSEDEVRVRTIPLYAIPHQFVQIKVGDEWVDVDIWARHLGLPFGERVHWYTPTLLLSLQKLFKATSAN